MVDRPNVLDDLWVDWENKTLEQKHRVIKAAVARMPKVLFSDTDQKNLALKSLEVAKALNLHPEPVIVTPSKKWLQDHAQTIIVDKRHSPRLWQRASEWIPSLTPGRGAQTSKRSQACVAFSFALTESSEPTDQGLAGTVLQTFPV